MGSLRSWLGSFLSLLLFIVARRFTTGLAAPTFVVIIFACTYIWTLVLRVPELRNVKSDEDSNVGASVTTSESPSVAGDGASTPAGTDISGTVFKAAPTPAAVTKELPVGSVLEKPHATTPTEATLDEGAAAKPMSSQEAAPPKDTMSSCIAAHTPPQEPAVVAASAAPVPTPEPVAADPIATVGLAAGSLPATTPADTTATEPVLGNGEAPGNASDRDGEHNVGGSSKAENNNSAIQKADDDESADEDEEKRRLEEENEHADPERAQELRLQGNEFFKSGRIHDAREAYSEAIYLMPTTSKKDRSVLYCNRAACLQKLGRWDDVVSDCKLAIDLDPEYTKAYTRRSAAFEELKRWHDANEDIKKAIELEPSLRSKECRRQAMLEQRAAEQFETDKTEMMGKLKDLGNSVLGKFGMSCDNFKMEQDPNTGSYSIKYQN